MALVHRWLPQGTPGLTDLRDLVLDLTDISETPADLLFNLTEAIATPEIPPDVTQVRIMSLHKSKGLSAELHRLFGEACELGHIAGDLYYLGYNY